MFLHFFNGYNLFKSSIVFLAAVTFGYGPYNLASFLFNLEGRTIISLGTFSLVISI